MKWGIFIHNPDGSMDDGIIVGPFTRNTAKYVAKVYEYCGGHYSGIECIVVEMVGQREVPISQIVNAIGEK